MRRSSGAPLRIPFLELLGAHAEEQGKGRAVVFCEGEVRAAGGQLVAKGLGTFKLRRARGGAPGPAGASR